MILAPGPTATGRPPAAASRARWSRTSRSPSDLPPGAGTAGAAGGSGRRPERRSAEGRGPARGGTGRSPPGSAWPWDRSRCRSSAPSGRSGPWGPASGPCAAALASALLVRGTRSPGRVYRVLLLAHVSFWTAHGLPDSTPRPPAPPDPPQASSPGPRPAPSGPGWGRRPSTSRPTRRSPAGAPLPGARAWPAFLGLGYPGRLSLRLAGPPRRGFLPAHPSSTRRPDPARRSARGRSSSGRRGTARRSRSCAWT